MTYVLMRIFDRETTALLDESEAIEQAIHCVATQYELAMENLEVSRYEEQDRTNVITVVADEREYTVTLTTSKKKHQTSAAIAWRNISD